MSPYSATLESIHWTQTAYAGLCQPHTWIRFLRLFTPYWHWNRPFMRFVQIWWVFIWGIYMNVYLKGTSCLLVSAIDCSLKVWCIWIHFRSFEVLIWLGLGHLKRSRSQTFCPQSESFGYARLAVFRKVLLAFSFHLASVWWLKLAAH